MTAMNPEDLASVARTLQLLQQTPPKTEGWNHPGDPTLEGMLRSWLRENI